MALSARDEVKTVAAVDELDYRITSARQKIVDLSKNIDAIILSLKSVESDYPELSILDEYKGADDSVLSRKIKRDSVTSERESLISGWQLIKAVADKIA